MPPANKALQLTGLSVAALPLALAAERRYVGRPGTSALRIPAVNHESIPMLLSTAEDLGKFIEELRRETDRGLPLVAAALIDDRLTETLRAFFLEVSSAAKLLDEGNAPLGTFSAHADACYALGLIDEHEYTEVTLIRKVRNEFAHAKHGTSFATPRVQGLCSSLKSDLPEGAGYPLQDARFRFTNAAVAIVVRLYHRPDWVSLERRQPKTWVDKDATKWRSVEDGLPPPGVPVIVMTKQRPQ